MKKFAFLLFIGIGLFTVYVAITSFKPSQSTNNYLIVRTVETQYSGFHKILISDGNSIIKTVELERMFVKSAKVTENFSLIAQALEEVRSQGYVLVSSNSAGGYEYMVTNYIFEKR